MSAFFLSYRKFCTIVLMLAATVSAQAAYVIEVGQWDFQDIFKDARKDWLQIEIPVTASPSRQINPENGDFLKNVKMTVTLAYDNRSDSRSKEPYVFFQTKSTFAVLPKQQEVMTYFFLPSEVIEYYGLGKRPEYYYLEFDVGGRALNPHDSFYNSKTKAVLEQLKSHAEGAAKKTEGMLLPLQLAPYWVVAGSKIDVKNLPTFAIKVQESE